MGTDLGRLLARGLPEIINRTEWKCFQFRDGGVIAFHSVFGEKEMPEHHRLYRQYWEEFRDCVSRKRSDELKRLMDEQQNLFYNMEFHRFKKTLPGYVDYWNALISEAYERLGGEEEDL